MAVDHYENFPVASLLLPRALRAAVRDIYRYARTADDIADEGHAAPDERLNALAEFRHALDLIDASNGHEPKVRVDGGSHRAHFTPPRPEIFLPLAATMAHHRLPSSPLRDLLSAFEQDVVKHRYEDDAELLDYCRRSADPIGRLLLHLYGRYNEQNTEYSDAICTGLQLTNFWQDVALDWRKGRLYLPRNKRQQHGVTEEWIDQCVQSGRLLNDGRDIMIARAWKAMMREQVEQAREMLLSGKPLASRLPFRAGLELRIVIQGGLRILERLDQLNYDVFERRPILRPLDWPRMALRAITQ